MPPKGSKKAAVPSTPVADDDAEDQSPSTPVSTVKKPRTPRKPKAPPKPFNKLPSSIGDATPIDVAFENETVHSKSLNGAYVQMVKLAAPQPFELVASYMLDDGLQAVIIKPSKTFPFMKLPKEIRHQIFSILLHPGEKEKIEITTDNKTSTVKAKDYAKGLMGPKGPKDPEDAKLAKHRLGLMAVNKELCAEGRAILYSYRLRFDNTTTLLNFLTTAGEQVRRAITNVTIVSYIKATAMPALTVMADCRNLERIHFVGGIGVNTTPAKAAKAFYADAGRLISALAAQRGGDKDAAMAVMTFGSKKCFSIKDDEDGPREWDDDEQEEFVDLVKSRVNAIDLPVWACVCGDTFNGHSCQETPAKSAVPLSLMA